jgi:hypothetical protein
MGQNAQGGNMQENYLYEQQWGDDTVRVGDLVRTIEEETNAYGPDLTADDGGWHMVPPGTIGRLVAMYLPIDTNEDADPDCIVRLHDGTLLMTMGQGLELYKMEV